MLYLIIVWHCIAYIVLQCRLKTAHSVSQLNWYRATVQMRQIRVCKQPCTGCDLRPDLVDVDEVVELLDLSVECSCTNLPGLIDDHDVEQLTFTARITPRTNAWLLCHSTSYCPPDSKRRVSEILTSKHPTVPTHTATMTSCNILGG